MTAITAETVAHVARLARLELTAEETVRYASDLEKILGLVAQLDALDLSGVEMALEAPEPTNFREDVAGREFTREQLMANAPHEEDGFFRVPRILGA